VQLRNYMSVWMAHLYGSYRIGILEQCPCKLMFPLRSRCNEDLDSVKVESSSVMGCVGRSGGLSDQIAWLENAAEDDKADAEESGEAERERHAYYPLRAG
jgi:hypothetical protein